MNDPAAALAEIEPTPGAPAWTPDDAADLYFVRAWGEGYFDVNGAGHVTTRPSHELPVDIDLYEVVQELKGEGVKFPCLIRLQDLLHTRVVQLNRAFRTAIEESGFTGSYTGVYPIKVNQLREVVEEILEAGQPFGFGLECGSKAELVATLPYLADDDTLLVCNGYKDTAMLRLMLTFQGLGKNVVPIVEKFGEFETIERLGAELDVAPRYGLRVRLATTAAGQWVTSSGDQSKFGVSTPEVLEVAARLRKAGRTEGLVLLHFHLGSQITDIQALKNGVKEITRVYAHLVRQGLGIRYLDVGGGLGVNYDGMPLGGGRGGVDYSMQEYANAIVYAVQEVCETEGVPCPTLVSENGRAVTAHHSVLVVEALGATTKPAAGPDFRLRKKDHPIVQGLYAQWQELRKEGPAPNGTSGNGAGDAGERNGEFSLGRLLEAYHDAVEQRQNADALFAFGYLDLEGKARAEQLFWSVCQAINRHLHRADPDWLPPELLDLDDLLVDQVLCDFSVFQSMMDYWSIGQRFPIVPLHRLDEEPLRRATLVDLTCDSDGKVNRFVSPEGDKRYLELHPLREGEPYYLGIFLMGAYQDILGDTHNLFGGVTEAHVYADAEEPGNYYVENLIPGTTVEQMLARVQYFPQELHQKMQALLRRKAREGAIRPKAATEVLEQYRRLFDAYTYYEPAAPDKS